MSSVPPSPPPVLLAGDSATLILALESVRAEVAAMRQKLFGNGDIGIDEVVRNNARAIHALLQKRNYWADRAVHLAITIIAVAVTAWIK